MPLALAGRQSLSVLLKQEVASLMLSPSPLPGQLPAGALGLGGHLAHLVKAAHEAAVLGGELDAVEDEPQMTGGITQRSNGGDGSTGAT